MAKYIRIKLPLRSPEGTFKLTKGISARHTLLGAASPLDGFVDMALFETNRTNALQLQEEGDAAQEDAQGKYNQATFICGIGKQAQKKDNRSTIYWFATQSRDVLKLKYRGTEEEMEAFGFNVVITVVNARRYVRVDIPYRSPEKMIKLAKDINAKHTNLGVASPLTGNVDMVAFNTLTNSANTFFEEYEMADELAQSKHNQALAILGYAAGQNSETPGTLYYDTITVRDRLMQFYSGAEEQMSQWKFDVVISTRKPGKKSAGDVLIIVQEGDVFPTMPKNIDLSGIAGMTIDTITFEAIGGNLRYLFNSSANSAPGPGTAGLDVLTGQSIIKNQAQLVADMNYSPLNSYLFVQNLGMMTAQYKVSIKTL